MSIIQRPDLTAKVRKAYEITGPDAIQTISPELVPVVILDDLSSKAPTFGCIGYGTMGASATDYGHVQLYNPATSDLVVLVKKIEFHCGTAMNAGLCLHDSDGDLTSESTAKSYTDRTRSGSPVARLMYDAVSPTVGTIIAQYWARQLEILRLEPNITLDPGQGVNIRGGTVNINVVAVYHWDEIPV